jgi:hypothetical protein
MIIRPNSSKDTIRTEVRDLKQEMINISRRINAHEREIAKLYTEGGKFAKRLRIMETRLNQK